MLHSSLAGQSDLVTELRQATKLKVDTQTHGNWRATDHYPRRPPPIWASGGLLRPCPSSPSPSNGVHAQPLHQSSRGHNLPDHASLRHAHPRLQKWSRNYTPIKTTNQEATPSGNYLDPITAALHPTPFHGATKPPNTLWGPLSTLGHPTAPSSPNPLGLPLCLPSSRPQSIPSTPSHLNPLWDAPFSCAFQAYPPIQGYRRSRGSSGTRLITESSRLPRALRITVHGGTPPCALQVP